MTAAAKIAMTGLAELDRELVAIATEDGPKSINAAMRKVIRETVKEIVLPEVVALFPSHDHS